MSKTSPEGESQVISLRYIQVVPGVAIGLKIPCVGDTQRFCRLFRETWEQIPGKDREALLDYLRSHPVTLPPYHAGLETGLRLGLQRGKLTAGFPALADGHTIDFCGPYMDSIPDWTAKAVIAHELAHIHLRIGNPEHLGQSFEKRKKAEHDANHLGDEWGFECRRAIDWHHEHVELWERCAGM